MNDMNDIMVVVILIGILSKITLVLDSLIEEWAFGFAP